MHADRRDSRDLTAAVVGETVARMAATVETAILRLAGRF